MVMAQVTCSSNSPVLIFVVVVVCWVGGIIDCLIVRECVSPTLPLSPWAVTRSSIYCTGQSATGSTETERQRERGEGKKCRARDSLLLSHPPFTLPHCQHRGSWLPLMAPQRHCSGVVVERTTAHCLQTNSTAVRRDLSKRSEWSLTGPSTGSPLKKHSSRWLKLYSAFMVIDRGSWLQLQS